ncbi:MAG: tetratricopeptide repeat protein [Candidatus Omnitrophica bacterium]|nr:tetratricopeptide repeat protein [Candidatus Omnitrophota bacterium]
MKRIIGVSVSLLLLIFVFFLIFKSPSEKNNIEFTPPDINITKTLEEARSLLKMRKDNSALSEFEKILIKEPMNQEALWGKAEVLRRKHKYRESERILEEILKQNPQHAPSLISLGYIKYHDDKLAQAMEIAKNLLNQEMDTENKALLHLLIGSINARRSSKGGLFSKLSYGTQIKNYFLKAVSLAPDLSETHLGLGSFYLMAPKIAGGNLDKAIEELEYAVMLTPDFATANARLAQAYKKKGDLAKFQHYLQRARELDPDNEVVAEIERQALK